MASSPPNEVEDFGRSNFDDDENNTTLPSWIALKKHNPIEYNRRLEEIITDVQPITDHADTMDLSILLASQRLKDHEDPVNDLIKDYISFFNMVIGRSLDFLNPPPQMVAFDKFKSAFFAWLKVLSDGSCIHLVKAICKTDMNPIEIYIFSKKKLSSLSSYLPLLLLLLPQDNQPDLIKKTRDVLRSIVGSYKTVAHESWKNLAEDLLFLIKSCEMIK
jgi:hypothetical protein